ncbi:MAG TPA: cohesin domain-containing protein [Candidatus Polarisedimenticolaceae bacterium]|nr:cohesin domain-containing protein [Candidatus Polarisedimenticolaceae bacterium]
MNMNAMRKVLIVGCLAVVTACGGGGSDVGGAGGGSGTLAASFTPDQGAPGANTVSLAQGSASGDTVVVRLNLTDTSNVSGVAFDLLFDSTRLTFLGRGDGNLFEQGGASVTYQLSSPSAGQLTVGVARNNTTPVSAVGTKTVVTFSFRVKVVGSTPVSFAANRVTDNQAPPQTMAGINWFAGTFVGN